MKSTPSGCEWHLVNGRLIVRLLPSGLKAIVRQREGVLLGRRGYQDGRPLIVIDSARPAGYRGPSIVGCFRFGGERQISTEDRQVFERRVGESAGAFLLLRREPEWLGGTLYYCYRGRVLGDRGRVWVPDPTPRVSQKWAVAAVVVLASAGLGTAGWRAWAGAAGPPPLDLDANWSGPEATFHWNVQALSKFESVLLRIGDDGAFSDYLLSRRQVEHGSFSYHPHGSDVIFRLEAIGEGGRSLHRILILAGGAQPAPAALPEPAVQPREPVRKTAQHARPGRDRARQSPIRTMVRADHAAHTYAAPSRAGPPTKALRSKLAAPIRWTRHWIRKLRGS